MFEKNGKNCSTTLLLFIKEVFVLAVSVVPEDSKEVTCHVRGVPGMKGLGRLWFCCLEEHLTTFWKSNLFP